MSNVVTILGFVLLAATFGASTASAETSQCRQINSRKERSACTERQAAARQARSESSNPQMYDAIEQMKIEDDKLARRLKGICRGC